MACIGRGPKTKKLESKKLCNSQKIDSQRSIVKKRGRIRSNDTKMIHYYLERAWRVIFRMESSGKGPKTKELVDL